MSEKMYNILNGKMDIINMKILRILNKTIFILSQMEYKSVNELKKKYFIPDN